MEFYVNIGLNVGQREPEGQYEKSVKMSGVINPKVAVGEWAGVTERTIHGMVDHPTFNTGMMRISQLCEDLCQESIAVYVDGTGYLVRKNGFNAADFDPQFFHV